MAMRKTIEDARLLFRNFAGREGQYNREGDRNFAVVIDDPKIYKAMIDEGWNIKTLSGRDEGEPDAHYVQVSVNYDGRFPPKVVMITERMGRKIRTDLTENEIETLDWVDIASADMTLNPYEWSVQGNSGVKAYLKSLFVTINVDELESKYSDVPYQNELEDDYIEGVVVEEGE